MMLSMKSRAVEESWTTTAMWSMPSSEKVLAGPTANAPVATWSRKEPGLFLSVWPHECDET